MAAFGGQVDYAQLVKSYPARGEVNLEKGAITGQPDMEAVSTSMVERQNLTLRMSQRRFTRKTNAFSKRVENHANAVALFFLYYNFCRIHQTLRVTPAMEAGICDTLYDIDWIVEMADRARAAPTEDLPEKGPLIFKRPHDRNFGRATKLNRKVIFRQSLSHEGQADFRRVEEPQSDWIALSI